MPMVTARGRRRLLSSFSGIALAGLPAATPAAHAEPMPILPLGSDLAADPSRGRVYEGTTNGTGQDQVDVLNASTT